MAGQKARTSKKKKSTANKKPQVAEKPEQVDKTPEMEQSQLSSGSTLYSVSDWDDGTEEETVESTEEDTVYDQTPPLDSDGPLAQLRSKLFGEFFDTIYGLDEEDRPGLREAILGKLCLTSNEIVINIKAHVKYTQYQLRVELSELDDTAIRTIIADQETLGLLDMFGYLDGIKTDSVKSAYDSLMASLGTDFKETEIKTLKGMQNLEGVVGSASEMYSKSNLDVEFTYDILKQTLLKSMDVSVLENWGDAIDKTFNGTTLKYQLSYDEPEVISGEYFSLSEIPRKCGKTGDFLILKHKPASKSDIHKANVQFVGGKVSGDFIDALKEVEGALKNPLNYAKYGKVHGTDSNPGDLRTKITDSLGLVKQAIGIKADYTTTAFPVIRKLGEGLSNLGDIE